jgi:hypothetical protein
MRLRATVLIVALVVVGLSIWWQRGHPPEGVGFPLPEAQAQAGPLPSAPPPAKPVSMTRSTLANPPPIPPVDLSKVTELDESARTRLAQEGLIAIPLDHSTRVPLAYADLKWKRRPILVTTDAALHISHQVFDWTLRFLEVAHLSGDLTNLTDALLAQMMTYVDQAPTREAKAAALDCATYLTIGKRLLAGGDTVGVPRDLAAKIEGELRLIERAEGLARSPLFGYAEDYSQYRPRGHYARSEEFRRYFRAMAWYGRMRFLVQATGRDPRAGGLSAGEVKHQTRQALLLCKALQEAKVKGETATQVWRRIYNTTAFFAGRADDLTFEEFREPVTRVWGASIRLADLADDTKLAAFQAAAGRLRPPQILSTYSLSSGGGNAWQSETKGLALFGARFSLDTAAFQQLTFDRVTAYQGPQPATPITAVATAGGLVRGFPLGLDLLAAFGSPEAVEMIRQGHDDAYAGYAAAARVVRGQFASLPDKAWTSDLYQARLNALRHCLADPDPRAPAYMKRPPWLLKQHQTALGAWTELRHDTILYTKQDYAMSQNALSLQGKGGPQVKPAVVKGYVEPCPEVYVSLRTSLERLLGILQGNGYPPDPSLVNNLAGCARLMAQLAATSDKELAGTPLTEQEYESIEGIGMALGFMLMFPHNWDVAERFQTEMDREMPVVADVATNVDAGEVLEEAVGWPMETFVIVPVEGRPTLCRGFTYSYYEFRQPMKDRLTDEAWRAMLAQAQGQPKPRPAWTAGFVGSRARTAVPPAPQQQH